MLTHIPAHLHIPTCRYSYYTHLPYSQACTHTSLYAYIHAPTHASIHVYPYVEIWQMHTYTYTVRIYIYIYISGIDGSVGQPKASKPDVPGSTPGSSCFSLVFIKNFINDKSKHKKTILLIVLYCPGPLAVIYNMYTSMTSRGVHLYPLFVLYSIYIYI